MNWKVTIRQGVFNGKEYVVAFLRWLVLGLLLGIIAGAIGAAFGHAISWATVWRIRYPWLLVLLPIGGVVSVAVYKLCRVTDIGTNEVFESIRGEKKVPRLLAPAVFVGATITHLFGGSAGREGAALQLGGSVSSFLGRVLRLDEQTCHILTMCGMGAFFSALFGTPMGASVFALEVVSVGHICSAAFFPAVVSAITAFYISTLLGITPEQFKVPVVPNVTPDVLWRVMVIAVAGALVSMLFCYTTHVTGYVFKRLFKNGYMRIVVGGVLIVLFTVLVGTTTYNGGGHDIIEQIFEGHRVNSVAFLLKIVFTAITIGAGFKGGEIVPTLFIGATLGSTVATWLGLDVGFGAAVGMAALFCGVTNCPLTTIVLCVELFGSSGLVFFALAGVTSFLLSGLSGLYSGQELVYSKLNEELLIYRKSRNE